MARLSRPPGLPSVLAGFLNLAGTAVPVIRFDKLFSLPEVVPGLHTPLIILRGSPGAYGVLASGVHQILSASASTGLPPHNLFHDCATAAIEWSGLVSHVLAPDRILLEKECRIVNEFRVIAQDRMSRLEDGQG